MTGTFLCGLPTVPDGSPCRRKVTAPGVPCGAAHPPPLSPTGAPPTGTPGPGRDPFAAADPAVSGVPQMPSFDVPAERIVDLTADEMRAVAVTDPARYDRALRLYAEADGDPDVGRLVTVAAQCPNPELRSIAAGHPVCTAAAAEALLSGWWSEGTLPDEASEEQARLLFTENADLLDEAFVARVAALPGFWRFAAAHPNCPPVLLSPATVTDVWDDEDRYTEVIPRILANPNCPAATITETARLWGDDVCGHRRAAAEDWGDYQIPLAAVTHPNCPASALAVFAAHGNPKVQAAAAEHPNWTASTQAHAALITD